MAKCINEKCKWHLKDHWNKTDCQILHEKLTGCYKYLTATHAPVADVRCNDGLDVLLEVVKSIRKSDCGTWLKDCNGTHTCIDGRKKRQDLMSLLDKLYKAANI